MFSNCPTTPPPYSTQRPPLTNWCKHESILCTSWSETMSSVMFRHTYTLTEFCKQDLERIVAHRPFDVNDAIWRNVRKEEVIILQLSSYLGHEKSLPTWKVSTHVNFRDILLIHIIDISFFFSVSQLFRSLAD